MGQRSGEMVVARRIAEVDIGARIGERRTCIGLDQTTHGVASVESTLWTAQHLDALDVGEVEVESRLVVEWDIIYIESHGRVVDARTDTAYIHGAGEARTIVGHEEVGRDLADALERRDLEFLEL